MTPITEDQVNSLMKGLEVRERRALARLSLHAGKSGARSVGMTGRVLRFVKKGTGSDPTQPTSDVVSLAELREAGRRSRTSKGLFFYVPGYRGGRNGATA